MIDACVDDSFNFRFYFGVIGLSQNRTARPWSDEINVIASQYYLFLLSIDLAILGTKLFMTVRKYVVGLGTHTFVGGSVKENTSMENGVLY